MHEGSGVIHLGLLVYDSDVIQHSLALLSPAALPRKYFLWGSLIHPAPVWVLLCFRPSKGRHGCGQRYGVEV